MTTPLAAMPPFAEFVYVDTAVGGVNRRNRIVLASEFKPPPGSRDCFATYFHYTEDLITHAAENPLVAPGDRPSVKGYRGPGHAPSFFADYDSAHDPERARVDAVHAVTRLIIDIGVPARALSVWFSGHKGFHLEVPGELFGGFPPGTDLPTRFRRLSTSLLPASDTLDPSLYQAMRLLRRENSQHGTSGLHKVRLSIDELTDLGMDEIRAIAESPRTLPAGEDTKWTPLPHLVALWVATNGAERRSPSPGGDFGTDDAAGVNGHPSTLEQITPWPLTSDQADRVVSVMTPHWMLGQKHHVALVLAGWMAKSGVPEDQAAAIVDRLSGDDTFPEDRKACVRDTYARLRAGQDVAGYRGLAAIVPPATLLALGRIRDGGRSISILGTPMDWTDGHPVGPVPDRQPADHLTDADSLNGSTTTTHRSPTSAIDGTADDLPSIDAGCEDLPRVTTAAWAAIERANDPPYLFRFGGRPTRIEPDPDHGAPVPRPLTEDRLRYESARATAWYKATPRRVAPALPPLAVVKDMLAAPEIPLPRLARVTEVPTFAPDGSLPDRPGYHAPAAVYYAPSPGLEVPAVPADPTPQEVAAAVDLLMDEWLGDFPFVGSAERAHALALALLPFLRDLIPGSTPLHLVEKPGPGTGAGLLVDVACRLATGRSVSAMTEGRDEDEWRKRITAKLRDGEAVILIDNLRRPLEAASVAAALTAGSWSDRVLGTSEIVRLPVRCTWVATGNNPRLSDELARRTVRIRLDAEHDRPWLRDGFRHPDLPGWTMANRGRLVSAALTLGLAWLAAGRPEPVDSRSLGSFESWSRVVGGVLAVAGVPGFLGNLAEFYERTDANGSAIRGFLRAWWQAHGETVVGAADLFPLAAAPESGLDLGEKGERSQRIRLGNRLGEMRDRRVRLGEDLTICVTSAGSLQRAHLWRLVASGFQRDRMNDE